MRNAAISCQRSAISASHGFSLVEVTLAMAVMAIGLIAILGLIPQGVNSSRNAADNTLVATIVHDAFSDLRRQALTLPWPPASLSIPNIYYDAAGTNRVLSTSADRYYNLLLTSQSPTPYLLTVTARVTWPDKSATSVPQNTNSFVTQIARYQ
jgi:uncharacterized protein (TIGR02598 family)